ncbi:VOC family protein [Bacillus paramycoides]|uniref:VOC family protein n=1 Tax=Bacillus paramycoides TaxID=2026194 RepID=UPI002E22F602
MIKGLYEAHLPVSNLQNSIEFYQKLGLKLAWCDEDTAFFWIEEGKSWLGLWEGNEYETQYHPSLRHIFFYSLYKDPLVHLCWSSVLGRFVVHAAINKRIIAVTTPKSPCLSHIDNAKFEPIARKISITVYLLNLIMNNLPMELYPGKFYYYFVP